MKTKNQMDYIKWTLEGLYTFTIQNALVKKWLIPTQEYNVFKKRFPLPEGFYLRQLDTSSKPYLFSLRGIHRKLIANLLVHCFYGEIEEPTEYRLH